VKKDKIYLKTIFTILILFFSANLFAQRIVDKNKGNHNNTKSGIMDGNLVQTVFYNFGEIADWQNQPTISGVWPKGSGHTYVDGVAVIVQSEVNYNGSTFHPLETNYYEYTRADPQTKITYGWWSLPGYASPYQSSVARSDDPNTWPSTWPDRPADWNGQWDGFFGKGIKNADLESFFAFDDNEDREYISKYGFYPDANDPSRGGLGMQVRGRGFQWSQVLAQDVIFWYYEITNMSTTDYPKSLFAQYVDWGIGGHDNSSNNNGDYNTDLDISYAWLTPGLFGAPGHWSPVGYSGYAFLESPGISDDNKDNDNDGLTDEKRDNDANVFISQPSEDPFLRNPSVDTATFRNFYGYSWQPHWDADENANWRTYTDINGNGKWDVGEPLNDDVGTDGIGPFDDGYSGPDADGSEGDGKPEQGEPNFGILDKDESDQLGLTGFQIFAVHKYDLNNDEANWKALLLPPPVPVQPQTGVNLGNFFSSYLFHMNGRNTYSAQTGQPQETGETQRFSMSLLFGIDKDDLFRRKKTIQSIYNANYHFAKPPDKPTITAIAGDHKVTLYWDDRAEKTFDAFYQRYNFEGYRIYRSTEPNFLEDQVITDAYGKATFRKPIAQFDLIDGVKGLHPIAVNGAMFNLGDDTGLKHSYVDTEVENGQTYYYAVVAYDKGFTTTTVNGEVEGIPPSETTSIIKQDINGQVKTDINTAVVTPTAPAAGYVPPNIANFDSVGPGTGYASINILNPDSVKDLSTYRVEFVDNTTFHDNPHPFFRLIDYSNSDTLIHLIKFEGREYQTPVFDGFSINMINDTSIKIFTSQTGWTKGNSNYIVPVGFDDRYAPAYQSKKILLPADFEIHLTEPGKGDTSYPASSFSQPVPSNIIVKDVTDGIDHFQFIFRDNDNDNLFTAGDAIFVVCGDSINKKATSFSNLRIGWSVSLVKDTSIAPGNQIDPQPGDVFKVFTTKPFRTGEYYQFTTKSSYFDKTKVKTDMNDIAVVPNPYAGAASWEPRTTDVGRGERRVFFIHLPPKCTIRIYTISGNLVQTIYHESYLTNGQEPWNLVSKDGMDIAFGVYIFHVEADEGEKIGKFAIIK
jgi:hypothetical protein